MIGALLQIFKRNHNAACRRGYVSTSCFWFRLTFRGFERRDIVSVSMARGDRSTRIRPDERFPFIVTRVDRPDECDPTKYEHVCCRHRSREEMPVESRRTNEKKVWASPKGLAGRRESVRKSECDERVAAIDNIVLRAAEIVS